MKHEAQIVPGSVKRLGTDGLVFQTWCCENTETIQTHTIHRAGRFTPEELTQKITAEYLTPHAEEHAGGDKAEAHLRALAGGVVSGNCGCGE